MPSAATLGRTDRTLVEPVGVTWKVTAWPASSAGPGLMASTKPLRLTAPASSATVTSCAPPKLGASLTGVTVTVNVCGPENPSPLSAARRVTSATPLASARGVKVSVPSDETAGDTRNSSLLVTDRTSNCSVWSLSSGGPTEMPVAQPAWAKAPESSATVTSAPLVKDGASLTGAKTTVKASRSSRAPPAPVFPWSLTWTSTSTAPLKSAAGVSTSEASAAFIAAWGPTSSRASGPAEVTELRPVGSTDRATWSVSSIRVTT